MQQLGIPQREHLYYVPPDDDPVWAAIQQVPHGRRSVRVLYSHNTSGTVEYMYNEEGIARVQDWSRLPDLQYWKPLQYFQSHPRTMAVWVEIHDTTRYEVSEANTDPSDVQTASSRGSIATSSIQTGDASSRSDASSQGPHNYALVMRRSECTALACALLRKEQEDYYRNTYSDYPDEREFRATLHNR